VCEGDVRERCGVAGDEAGLVCGGTVDEDLRDGELVVVLEFLFRALVILMSKVAQQRKNRAVQCSHVLPAMFLFLFQPSS